MKGLSDAPCWYKAMLCTAGFVSDHWRGLLLLSILAAFIVAGAMWKPAHASDAGRSALAQADGGTGDA